MTEKICVSPAFADGKAAIPIFMASSRGYAPFLAVSLSSIIAHASDRFFYDIVIGNPDFDLFTKERIRGLRRGKKNVSIRFMDCSELLCGDFYVRGHVTPMTYVRLNAPEFFSRYDKILYLDSDTVAVRDLSELFFTELSDCCLGAVCDTIMAGWYAGGGRMRGYLKKRLSIGDGSRYFNAGVLLMNIKAMNAVIPPRDLIDFARKRKWFFFDQDVLNYVFKDRVRYLDIGWNTIAHVYGNAAELSESYAPAEIRKGYFEALKAPKIVHFAGNALPCNYPDVDFAEIFWENAYNTPFYEQLLYALIKNTIRKCGGL